MERSHRFSDHSCLMTAPGSQGPRAGSKEVCTEKRQSFKCGGQSWIQQGKKLCLSPWQRRRNGGVFPIHLQQFAAMLLSTKICSAQTCCSESAVILFFIFYLFKLSKESPWAWVGTSANASTSAWLLPARAQRETEAERQAGASSTGRSPRFSPPRRASSFVLASAETFP